jgi:hypothetical protein
MNRYALSIAATAFGAVILLSLALTGVFSGPNASAKDPAIHDRTELTNAIHMPVNVRETFSDRERGFDALGQYFVRVDEGFVDDTTFCNFCFAVEYKPGTHGKATIAFESKTPLDLSNATLLRFAIRGDNPGETIKILGAGAQDFTVDINSTDSGIRNVNFQVDKAISVTFDWTLYEVSLSGLDLKEITHGFAFEMLSSDMETRQVIYLDAIYYDSKHAEYATPLT